MTAEETISILKIAIAEVEWNYPMDYAVAIETAIQALEKQIPKKVIWENEKNGKIYSFHWACCPNCGNELFDIEIGEFKFCSDCGQTLDWSEENE